jgi:PAS domain S-box-containing protein
MPPVKNNAHYLEARYRTLAEAMAQIIWVADPDGAVIEVSDAWSVITGYPKELALGRRFLDLIPPEDVAAFADRWAVALAGHHPFETEFRLRHADGHFLYVRSRSVPVWADGRVLERIGTLTDVTSTKVAEEARRMSEQRFATAFDASPMPMAIRDASTHRLLAANQAYLDLTGYSLDELAGIDVGEGDHWRGQPNLVDALQKAFRETGRLRDVQVEIRRKSGETRTVMFRAESVEIDGRPCSLITLADITARVRAESALQASEEMFSQAFNLSPIAMTIRDTTDGNRLIRANQAYLELTGYSAEELVGTLPDQIKLFVDRPLLVAQLEKMHRGGGHVRDFQTQLRRKSGELATVLIRSELITVGGRPCALSTVADVTERIRGEQALAESEDRFRRLSEAAWEGIALVDNGVLMDSNPQLAAILGYEPDELVGRPIADFVAPHSLAMVLEHHRLGSPEPYEHDAVRKDGTLVRVEGRGRMVSHKGRTIRMTALRDISERKRAEQALAESEERFRRLSDAAWEGVALTENGIVVDVNPQLAAMLGYEPAELIGRPMTMVVAPDSVEIVRDYIRRGSTEPFEHQARRKDGTTFMVQVRGQSMTYKGRTIRMAAIRDISERTRAEHSRRALVAGTAGVLGEDFFRSLVRHLARALNVKYAFVGELQGPDHAHIRAHSMWAGETYGEPFSYALAGTPSALVLTEGLRYFGDGIPELFPHDAVLMGMGVVSYAGVALFDANRAPIGLLVVADVAPLPLSDDLLSMLSVFGARAGAELERIRAEAEVRRLNADLERRVADRTSDLEAANRELESFSYSVSHDLRAPLRHIGGFVELLQRDAGPGLPGEAREHLEEIAGAASRMGTLIDDLLEFSRVGRAGLHLVNVELSGLVQEVIGQLSREFPDRRLEWQSGALPAVHGDRNLLWQVFYNLLANAVKYTRPREVARIEIATLPGTTPNQIVCAVRDNGVGFDPRYAHKLFGVFQRLHAASAFEGTGIGLANVQRIVQRHGGRVWAEGKVDEGATFYVSLPAGAR